MALVKLSDYVALHKATFHFNPATHTVTIFFPNGQQVTVQTFLINNTTYINAQ